jgi:hypothetical protein
MNNYRRWPDCCCSILGAAVLLAAVFTVLVSAGHQQHKVTEILVVMGVSTFQTVAIPGIVDTNGLAIASPR